jgi:hypothetical protein
MEVDLGDRDKQVERSKNKDQDAMSCASTACPTDRAWGGSDSGSVEHTPSWLNELWAAKEFGQ